MDGQIHMLDTKVVILGASGVGMLNQIKQKNDLIEHQIKLECNYQSLTVGFIFFVSRVICVHL